MQIASYAKINWSLRILRKRPDGFHELETLFQQISLHDDLTFTRSDHLSLTCDARDIPSGESNLVMRAARALGAPPVAITLKKRIPAGGGLGGGSSNAAATLRAIDTLLDLRTPNERLHDLALQLGSDVPFFLLGGTAYATGRGELLTPLPAVAPVPLVLILPEERVSTAEAFAAIRSYSEPLGVEAYRRMIDDDLLAHASSLSNDFESPIFARHPRLREYKDALLACGAAWAGMSGSGSTIVGAFRSQAVRDDALRAFTGASAVAAETV
ncbi:MAG: 4-(cytidine 5'-diphospho)-2-C-methyl-D-erythritol kinase [Thermoanaerobaculia bacterium]